MIRDLQLGNAMEQPCLVRLQKVGTSSNGKPYAKGLLEDNSGCIPFICFEAGPIGRLRTMEAPTPYIIGGKVDVNKYSTTMAYQVIVQKVQAVTEEDDLSDLLPSGHIDLEKYKMEFQAFMGRIQAAGLRELVETLLSGRTLRQFLKNPAGKRLPARRRLWAASWPSGCGSKAIRAIICFTVPSRPHTCFGASVRTVSPVRTEAWPFSHDRNRGSMPARIQSI